MNCHFIFPNQLFKNVDSIERDSVVFVIEEYLFFNQYKFHKQKLAFHRASMKAYDAYIRSLGFTSNYIEAIDPQSDIRLLIESLSRKGCSKIIYADVCDEWLGKRILNTALKFNIKCEEQKTQLFINSQEEIRDYFKGRKRYLHVDFYVHQRKKRGVLIDSSNEPVGGKWSFDEDNRLKYPKGKVAPQIIHLEVNEFYKEAINYVNEHYGDNYGELNAAFLYPTTFDEANKWLMNFFETRFAEFGVYEDAIVEKENVLHHSMLTPMLNVGLLTPSFVIDSALKFASENNTPLNSLEGFIRQILGWREFIRAIYLVEGSRQRTTNYWGYERKIPSSFYDGTTGIAPIDSTIKRLLPTGYSHHIERLMILSNFMLLCEFDPNEVYKWFMEMYIDAYDWVMVPNVYGMGQFADGGIMSTKPYISGSNYVFKMSDYKKDSSWSNIWDALFWRFMHVNRDFFLKNPRLGMLVRTYDKMPDEKREMILKTAEDYLKTLNVAHDKHRH